MNEAYESGMIFSVVDSRMGCYPSNCVERFFTLALSCCHENTNKRPSMLEVVRELENIFTMLPETKTRSSDITSSYSGRLAPSSSSTSTSYLPGEYQQEFSVVSGSNLVSDIIPSIVPR